MSVQKIEMANKILISLGIINQLTNTLLSKKLAKYGLNPSQFDLLTHLMRHSDKPQTVSQLAQVMQMNQPGVTKVVNKLHQMKFINIEKGEHDGRKKWVSITPLGLTKVKEAYESLAPYLSKAFEEWDLEEMQLTNQKIDKLMLWLDDNREL